MQATVTDKGQVVQTGHPAHPGQRHGHGRLSPKLPVQEMVSLGRAMSTPLRQHVVGSTPEGIIDVGTPATDMSVIFDTGSDKFVAKTWATIQVMVKHMDGGLDGALQPTRKLYNRNLSSTYEPLYEDGEDGKVLKQDFVQYGSGSAVTAECKETVKLGGHVLTHFPMSEIEDDSLSMLHTDECISGVFGLQHMKNESAGESAFSQLRNTGVMHSFGYCRARNNTGTFVWGDEATDGQEVEVVGDIHWAVNLANVRLRSKRAHGAGHPDQDDPAAPAEWLAEKDDAGHAAMCPHGECVTIIDTGSNIIAGPAAELERLAKTADIAHDCSNLAELPDLQLTLGQGVEITLPGEAYVMKMELPSYLRPGEGVNGEGPDASSHAESMVRWTRKLDHLAREHGIDLALALRGVPAEKLLGMEHVCAPAFMPLDMRTKAGSLWVIGTPLFEKYYARFSWPQGDPSPKIFFREAAEASACERQAADVPRPSAPAPPPSRAASMVRSERRGKRHQQEALQNAEESSPQLGQLVPHRPEEIRFPRWAANLAVL